MSTIIDELKSRNTPHCIAKIASDEGIEEQQLIRNIINGSVVIPRNNQHAALTPIAIGKDTRIKINANIGISPSVCDFENEMDKVKTAIASGADTVMDLSIAGDISGFRKRIAEELHVTLGTVPIYEAMEENLIRELKQSGLWQTAWTPLKGGHLKSKQSCDILYSKMNDTLCHFEAERIDTINTHGPGCTLSSTIASNLAKGPSIREAILRAKEYITQALKVGAAYRLGSGHGSVHHFHNFWE